MTAALHFPFLTYQWERPSQGGQFCASQRAARDGATIVRNIDSFCQAAEIATPTGKTASVIDKAHFSVTCDTETAKLWVHWLEPSQSVSGGKEYYMHCIKKAFLRPDDERDTSLVDMRKMLQNILWYAVTKRLAKIKTAIKALDRKRKEGHKVAMDTLHARTLVADSDDPRKKRTADLLEAKSTKGGQEVMEGNALGEPDSGKTFPSNKKQRLY
jgi:hypothetical protein